MVLIDQFVLCKAALIFAVTRWLLSFALNLLTSSMGLFSSSSDSFTQNSAGSSSCCSSSSSSSSSSSANLRIMRKSLPLTTLENIQNKLPENQDVSCAVCLNRLRKKSQVWELSNCNHVFHKHCLERWLAYDNRSTCPLCRASLFTESSLPPASQPQPQPPSWAVERMLYLFGDDLLPGSTFLVHDQRVQFLQCP
ncbi:hypothetical protein Pfo_003929 [Paulownia fortunei]|nr:hypothetical protein Pfo_003929 [Paulownia fortunei]